MENDEHFRKAFMFFDKDGSGYIEFGELETALVDESGENDTAVVNDIMREVDTDKVSHSCITIFFLETLPMQFKEKHISLLLL